MLQFLYQRYSANRTVSNGVLHFTLSRARYTGRVMQHYAPKCEQMSAQVTWKDTFSDKTIYVRMFVKNYGNSSTLLLGNRLSALLLRDDVTWKLEILSLVRELAFRKGSRLTRKTGLEEALATQ